MGSKPKKISASRVSKLLGLNKFDNGSVLDLWFEVMDEEYPGWLKKNGYEWEPKNISDRPEIQCGLIFEMPIIEYVAEQCGMYTNSVFEPEYSDGVLSCHCDSHLYSTELKIRPRWNVEAKTSTVFSFRDNWGESGTDQIPDYYYSQVQVQMGLSGIHKTIVPLLAFPNRQIDIYPHVKDLDYCHLYDIVKSLDRVGLLKLYYVDFNQKVFDKIKYVAEDFWDRHISEMLPPLNAELPVEQKFILPVNGKIENPEMVRKAQKIKDIDDQLKDFELQLKTKKHELLKSIIEMAPENKSGKVQLLNSDGKVAATFNSKTGRFSVRRIKENGKN